MSNNIFPHFPKEKFRVRVQHFPNGKHICNGLFFAEPSEEGFDGRGQKYVTRISVFKREDNGIPLFTVYARCHKNDIPRRKEGFRVAYEKAVQVAQGLGLIPKEGKVLQLVHKIGDIWRHA